MFTGYMQSTILPNGRIYHDPEIVLSAIVIIIQNYLTHFPQVACRLFRILPRYANYLT